jgi:hypothetical protein
MENSMIDLHETAALAAAKKTRAQARDSLATAEIALTRAQRFDEDARSKVIDLEQAVAESHAAQGQELAARISSGLEFEMPPNFNDRADRLTAARSHATVTGEALKALQAKRDEARDNMKNAEAQVAAHAELAIEAKRDSLAAEFDEAWSKVLHLGDELRGLLPSYIDRPINLKLGVVSPRVQRALDRLLSLNNDIHTPINFGDGASRLWAPAMARLTADDISETGRGDAQAA